MELIISLAVGSVVATIIVTTLTRQQRFYTSAGAVLDTRAQLRDASDILATEIRSAAVDLGVPTMRDSAIEIFSIIGSSIVCTIQSPLLFGLPPLEIASGVSLTSMLVQPDTGDLALVYSIPRMAQDSGSWELRGVNSFSTQSSTTGCPQTSGFTSPSDLTNAFVIGLATPTLDSVRVGAPIHFVRRSRYSLYRSSDNKWYLGYRRCRATGPSSCATVQPVSGPYDPYPGGKPGLSFKYYDATGTPLSPASDGSSLARVDIVVRARNAKGKSLAGDAASTWSDSTVVSIATRNRWR